MGWHTRATFATAALLLGAAAPADLVPIEGTGVSLYVPPGFRVANDFPGIGRDADLTSVLVTELPLPLERTRESFTEKALAEQDITVHRAGPVEVGGHVGVLLHVSQTAEGIPFRKWVLVLGDETSSVLVVATTPRELEALHQQALVETLSTLRWIPGAPPPIDGALPFSVRVPAGLQVVASSPKALVLSEAEPAESGERIAPLVSIGVSLAHVRIDDLPSFSRRRASETSGVEAVSIVSERPGTLGGLRSFEIVATARDVDRQRPLHLSQVVATDGDHYYLLQGLVEADEGEAFAETFRGLVESFELRP